jgi:hypothetical protein
MRRFLKKISLSIFYVLLLLLCFNATAIASDITISGSAQFECNLLSKYMKKHGYSFIKEIKYKNNFKTNLFAANDAEVIIKNKLNITVGVGKTGKNGDFSISVPRENTYRIIVRFHGREIEDTVSYSDAKNFIADLGYFESEKVASWIQRPGLSYCYTCNIRYLEIKDSL